MRSEKKLKKGKTYDIRYKGYHGYDSYSGTGIYTGKTDDNDGKIYGFKIDGESDICYFPLEDIFEL